MFSVHATMQWTIGIKGTLHRNLAKSGVSRKVFSKGSVADIFSRYHLRAH
jgi:hypothetical protein